MKRVAIVGSGAIGCYYGALLVRAGVEVHFLMRSNREAVKAHGLRVRTPDGNFSIDNINVAGAPEEIGPCDLVVVALKTTANDALQSLVGPFLHAGTEIVTLQNGLGSDEQLAALFGAERVFGGLCFVCVNQTGPGEVLCLSPGTISFGEFGRPAGPRLAALVELFSRAGVRCRGGDNLAALRWQKLVWNVPFNGLSILAGGLTTDRILADANLEREVRGLMAEVIGAAGQLGYSIPLSFIDQQIEHTRPMGPYRPSSLIDFQAGRPVEVESIWGEVVRRAQAADASIPKISLLYATLRIVTFAAAGR